MYILTEEEYPRQTKQQKLTTTHSHNISSGNPFGSGPYTYDSNEASPTCVSPPHNSGFPNGGTTIRSFFFFFESLTDRTLETENEQKYTYK